MVSRVLFASGIWNISLKTYTEGKPSLLIFSALSIPPFRSVKLRSRRPTCPACGIEGQKAGSISETDYVSFCGGPRPDWEAQGLVAGELDVRIRAKASHYHLCSRFIK